MFHSRSDISGESRISLSLEKARAFDMRRNASLSKQRGSLLIMALFIIIVLSLLAGAMIKITSNSSASVANEVYGLRAQQSANAGIQSLISQSFPVGSTPQVCQATITSPSSFSNIPGLKKCQYTARCQSEDIQYLGSDYRHYKFTSTGVCDLQDELFSRTIAVDAIQML